ncbi:MAG TPA: Cys-rich protein [Leptospiraceae bacterium]|nr:Cys-rich protein [Leptospiraceae bacterium]HMW07276.1 Cys-rich protein [Leptospiraceae bacterium]HMX33715.1 Cys-rich protein [Leptospiraceae bacterium]HMY32906.1 Cys-rich protein [Leptospiraceae bacterium]HMZ66632.1 Cys-rich protein [Leptospiraceae bacterium]
MKLIISSLLVFSLFSSLYALDPKCAPACDRFLECAKEMNKGKSATAAEIKRMKDGCLNACKRNTKAVLACYESSQETCNEFALCISKSYSATKK